MEARILQSYYTSLRSPPTGEHRYLMRGIRSEIYSLQPRVYCVSCKESLDVLNDGWYTCSKNPGSYCAECAGKHDDAFYIVDGEMRKDPQESYKYEPPPKPETFRKIRMYLAVQTVATRSVPVSHSETRGTRVAAVSSSAGAGKTPPPRPEGPSFKFSAVSLSPTVRVLGGTESTSQPSRVVKEEKQAAYRALMARIGPDRLPPLEVQDRRTAYLESQGYTQDPAYLSSSIDMSTDASSANSA